jgi:pyruvate/2-oxoglutarate dehydrogenase complex dihydrolipoamide acyltransferase (E2) component
MRTHPSPSGYSEKPWPQLRNAIVALLESARPNAVGASVEVDITNVILQINRIKIDSSFSPSLHAYILFCLSRACAKVPEVRTYRYGRNRLITFDDVDVATPIEKSIDDCNRIPVGYVLRSAQSKSLADITAELHSVKILPDLDADPLVLKRRRFSRLPKLKKFYGTVALTSVLGANNNFPLFPHIPTAHTLTVAIGSKFSRYCISNTGALEYRDFLCITIMIDHEVVDGMPLAHFIKSFTDQLSSGDALSADFAHDMENLSTSISKI